MFSGESLGEFGFSELPFTPLDSSAFQAFLDEIVSRRVWLLELDAFSLAKVGALSADFGDAGFGELALSDASAGTSGGVTTLRFASQGFISQGTDSPAYTAYDPRLNVDGLRLERSIANRAGIGGLTTLFAEATLVNADGGFDLVPANYSLDGRKARILVGRDTDPLAAFGLVFTGVVSGSVQLDLGMVRIPLSDGAAKLDVPLNPTTYGGAGGLDGGTDLAGKPKPRCWGHVYNIPPPLVDSANLIYQVNDGLISDVPNVYDRGVALTKVVGAPGIGQYQVTVATGSFKLGGTPAGTVTCDVLGDASGSGYVNRTADIVQRILSGPAGLTSSEVDPATFANLNTDAGAEVGIYVGAEPRLVSDVVDELLFGVGAFGGFSRQGPFTVGVIKAAAGSGIAPAASYTETDVLDLRRQPRPAQVDPIAFRASVNWQKNYTVQDDLAASVPAARVSFAAQEARVAKVEDTALRSRFLLSVEYGPIPSLFAQQADATAEAQRLFNLWSQPTVPYEIDLRPTALTRDLGSVVNLTHRRMGFASTRAGRVIGHKVQGSTVTLTLLA